MIKTLVVGKCIQWNSISLQSEWLILFFKSQQGWDTRPIKHSGGDANRCSHNENILEVLQKSKNSTDIWSSTTTPAGRKLSIPDTLYAHGYGCTTWQESKYETKLNINQQMNKEMHVYKMEFYSARKKMKLLFVGKWMKREHHARKSLSHMQCPFKHTHMNICNRNFISQNFSYRDRYVAISR